MTGDLKFITDNTDTRMTRRFPLNGSSVELKSVKRALSQSALLDHEYLSVLRRHLKSCWSRGMIRL